MIKKITQLFIFVAIFVSHNPYASMGKPVLHSALDLFQQLFIDKKINNIPFDSEQLKQAFLALDDKQANNLQHLLNAVLINIKKMEDPDIKIPAPKNSDRKEALANIEKINNQILKDRKAIDQGIMLLSHKQRAQLHDALNKLATRIAPIAVYCRPVGRKSAPEKIPKPFKIKPLESAKTTPLSQKQPAPQPELQPKPLEMIPEPLIKTEANAGSGGGGAVASLKPLKQTTKSSFIDMNRLVAQREQDAQIIKNAKTIDEELKKMLTPSDPHFLVIHEAIENHSLGAVGQAELPTIEDPNGYSPLLHAIYRNDFSIVQLLLARYTQKLYAALLNSDHKEAEIWNRALHTSINGLNPYQFAAFLEKRDKKNASLDRTATKCILRSILAQDLPDQRIIMPLEIFNKTNDEIIDWVGAHHANNRIFIVDLQSEQHGVYNLILALFMTKNKTFEQKHDLFIRLLKKNINVRYEFFQMFCFLVLNFNYYFSIPHGLIYEIFEKLVYKALEQGEPIENINEMYNAVYMLASVGKTVSSLPFYWADRFKSLIDNMINNLKFEKKMRIVGQEISKYTAQDIPLPLLRASQNELLAIKLAIGSFDTKQPLPLNLALGENNKNLSLQDALGYTPLLYAVYLNNVDAVRFLVEEIIALQGEIIKLRRIIEKNNRELKGNLDRIQQLSKNNENNENVDAIAKLQEQADSNKKNILYAQAKLLQAPTPASIFSLTTKDGLNAYCLAQFLGYKKIMELLAPFFKDECPK